ncbi:XRE family transcriptional regulator [Psychrobacter lutiphocae]|uniref:XRE family transcriptional regulator n=1 Tax=Psychrobacter lutiphocae TaxID=540500 RepID=UPI0003AB1A3C|nr:helix-turn-helix domain-containing protein [Psychrobacter lutiphocae]
MSNDLKQIANRIRQCMKEEGLKQVDIVKTTGVSKGSVSKWLSGKAKPSGESLLRLSQVLDTSEYWLLHGEDPYTGYSNIDDAQDYFNALDENNRDLYIKELGLDPKLPYSIRFLKQQYEQLDSDRLDEIEAAYTKSLEQLEPSDEQIAELEDRDWDWELESEDDFKNKEILDRIKNHSTVDDFIDNYQYSDELAQPQSQVARRAHARLEKTLFYRQTDRSMEPIITIGAQCSIDLTRRQINNGQLYLILRHDFLGIRTLFIQSDGSLLLKPKNSDYPDESISKSEVNSLQVIGHVYAWTNINPW